MRDRGPGAFAAIDLGAESGRVVAGRMTGDAVELEVVHRFANRPVVLPDGLRWNLLALFGEALDGLAAAAAAGPLRGIGVDAWGVDYALLDGRDRVLGLPFHHRDGRTEGMVARAHARVPPEQMYERTGIQTLPINTVFQLLADEGSPALEQARAIALVPDLLGLWLSGERRNERTIASTTGLLDARSGDWALELISALGLPTAPFGPVTEPGTRSGGLLRAHARRTAVAPDTPVYAVAGHDTASAFAAAPVGDPAHAAILSSGTWSLLGLEVDAPVLDARAMAHDLTNEAGIDATTRLLKNVMGLWLVQECRRAWAASGAEHDYEALQRLAASADPQPALFDPDDPAFLAPGDMPSKIAAACSRSGQSLAGDPGSVVRATLLSLACKYRLVLERLADATGRDVRTIHVIGGGARNTLLCRLTADVTALPVVAGPVEATALGNVLMQARAAGELGGHDQLRALALASSATTTHEPGDTAAGEAAYRRFLSVTSLAAGAPSGASA